MNSQQLQCFLCVADKLNFTKAAEELYLSTPTVTHHIKSLEEELNTLLFIRNSRMVKLTEAGIMFYSDAKEIMSRMKMAEQRLQKMSKQNISFIRIGCSSNAELLQLKQHLRELREMYPSVYPQITVSDYFSLKNLFNNKQLDIVLVTKEMVKDMQNCTFKKVREIGNYAVLSQEVYSTYHDEVTFEELEEECLITLYPKFIPFQYGNKLQEKVMLHSQAYFTIVCENDQAAVLLAKCGYGIAILPEFCVPFDEQDLFALPISNEDYRMDYGIAYHKNTKVEYVRYLISRILHF